MPLQNNDPLTLDTLKTQVEDDNQGKYQDIEKISQGGIWKNYMRPLAEGGADVVEGVGRGTVNAGIDIFNTVTDLGFYAGVEIADYGLDKIGREVDEDQVMQDLQGFRDKFTDYVRSEEQDNNVVNFAMNTTESVGKFYIFYKNLLKTGASKTAGALGAGFGEGATDDPKENNLLFVDKGLRAGLQQIAPESVNDFDLAMNPETGQGPADQAMRRVLNGLEMGMFTLAGDKAIDAAKFGGQAAAKSLPEPVKQRLIETYGKVMHRSRKAKEWLKGDKKTSFDKYVADNTVHQAEFEFVGGAMTPEKTAKQNIKDSVTVAYDSQFRVLSDMDYSVALENYETKLAELAPKINEEIVSMAKSRGISEKEQLAKFAKELGLEEAEMVNLEGLKNVLRAQAHNVLFEQQATTFAAAHANFGRGVLKESEYLEAAKSFYTTVQQRSALLSQAGRTLRTGQEIPKALQDVNKAMLAQGRSMESVMEVYGKSIDDPEMMKMFAKKTGAIMQQNHVMGNSPEEVYKAMTKAMVKIDPTRSKWKIAKDNFMEYLDAIETTYQANLLSATTTLAQNTFGSMAQMFLRAGEGAIETGLAAARVGGPRVAGTPTAREAVIQYKTMVQSHWDAMLLSAKATAKASKALATRGQFDADGMFKNKMMDMPEMSRQEREFMYRMSKEDMSAGGGTINQRIDKNRFARVATARPVFDIIQMQDMTTKTAAAKAYMRAKFDTALYVDDVFGIKGNAEKLPQAEKIMTRLFQEGRDTLTPDELTEMGLKSADAVEVSIALKEWRHRTSQEAAEYGIEAAMQKKLEGSLANVQNILQEKLPLGRLVVPFFTTPVNIFNESLKRMPMIQIGDEGSLGLPIHPQFYADFKAGGERRRQAVSKLTSGIALVEMGRTLAEQGWLTGVPLEVDKRIAYDQLMSTPAGSMRIGEQSYPLAFLGPVGILLTYGANMERHDYLQAQIEHMSEEDQNKFQDSFLFSAASMMQIAREQPYAIALDQLSGLFEFNPEDENAVEKAQEYMARMAGNLMPYSSAQRQLSNAIMEEQTRANGMWETTLQSFYPYENHKAYTAFGETVDTKGGFLLRSQKAADDQLANTLYQYAGFMPRAAKFKMTAPSDGDMRPAVNVRLNRDQWDEFHRILREEVNVRKRLETLVSSKTFADNVRSNKLHLNKKLASSEFNNARSQALELLISRDKEMQYNINKERQKELVERNVQSRLPAGAQTIEFNGGAR